MRDRPSKKSLKAIIALCAILAFYDLGVMSGWKPFVSIGALMVALPFWFLLLGIYLAPMILLVRRFPRPSIGVRWIRVAEGMVATGVVGLSLLIPCLRFLPGYAPDALDALKYILGPCLSVISIAVYFGAESLAKKSRA